MPHVAIDREMPALFFVVDVQRAGAVVHRSLAGDRSGREQEGVGKAGLARRPMPSERDIPDIRDVISRPHETFSRPVVLSEVQSYRDGGPFRSAGTSVESYRPP